MILTVKAPDIVTFDVSDEWINEAIAMRQRRDQIYGNIYSETDTDLRWCGDLGEVVINHALGLCKKEQLEWFNGDNASGIGDFNFCGIDIDVKTVKRKVPIRPYYKAQITAKHTKTPVDWMIFTCYQFPVKKLHILGAMSKKEFLDKADYYGPGDKVHENYTIREGHEIYAVTISEMTPIRDFIRSAMKGNIAKAKEAIAA